MKTASPVLLAVALLVLPVWSSVSVARGVGQVQWNLIVDTRSVSVTEAFVLCHALILFVWTAIVARLLVRVGAGRRVRHSRSHADGSTRVRTGVIGRATTWLSASAVLAPAAPGTASVVRVEASVPVGTIVSPAMAAGVLAYIIRRRREQAAQIGFTGAPDRLDDAEVSTLGGLRQLAIEYDSLGQASGSHGSGDEPDADRLEAAAGNPDVRRLLDAVERPALDSFHLGRGVVREWQVVVKVFGYPVVADGHGTVADFRKKRSLELLTWLCLNRDRQRRSAARTALWEVDVSDGTFSTVVSEMRRSLADLCPTSAARDWCPATYSDEIPLKSTVVTDADLLEDALAKFLGGAGSADEVALYLGWIRDVPFAGTTYSWADLDGTTTRLVILAIEAATAVARWGMEHERPDLVTEAVAAGLRVMPGCEELLELQEQLVRAKPTRSVARSRR